MPQLVRPRLRDHQRRCERIVGAPAGRPSTAFEIASRLWPARTVAEQPLLVVWEVLGHLELLLAGGDVAERTGDGGSRLRADRRRAPVHACRADDSRPALARRRPAPARIRQEVIDLHEPADISPKPADDALALFDLSGRVALVTGGTRGLGLAMARAFSPAGADVVVTSRKEDACDEVAAALRAAGGRAFACPCHVGRWDELDAAGRGRLSRVRARRRPRQQRRRLAAVRRRSRT